ncbi:MAG: hypothetical protein ACQEWU_00540 [Bacillota bacterium]|uniref:DNA-binding protein n=1 Tax=Virgibacillus salarius TaxID=447199 RepID=A0A941DPE4_9BACI|nr:hypothetical protein [Virgibacillus salarius]MBR7794469.1 hypothetical protein [Virgibacillus salarius]NAZ07192.1 hypothetical protein [Agaribacter marinus]WBX78765.1 hypothetical protein PD280_12950 [Virgibacillus salarius]
MAFELKEEGFRLKDIFPIVGIPEATYHYHVKTCKKAHILQKSSGIIFFNRCTKPDSRATLRSSEIDKYRAHALQTSQNDIA